MSKNPKYLNSKIPKIKAKKGIALLIALGTMIVILTIGSLSIYLITKGLKVTAGQTRYETAYESAVASLEIGKARANYLNQDANLDLPDTSEIIQVGKYTVNLDVNRGSIVPISGMAMKFGRAISGPGSSPATYRTYYIKVKSVGRAGEQVTLEVLQRYTIASE